METKSSGHGSYIKKDVFLSYQKLNPFPLQKRKWKTQRCLSLCSTSHSMFQIISPYFSFHQSSPPFILTLAFPPLTSHMFKWNMISFYNESSQQRQTTVRWGGGEWMKVGRRRVNIESATHILECNNYSLKCMRHPDDYEKDCITVLMSHWEVFLLLSSLKVDLIFNFNRSKNY